MNRRDWVVLAAICVAWIGGAAAAFWKTGDPRMWFLAINSFAALTATYVAVISAYRTAQLRTADLSFQKVENAFAFCERWNAQILVEARDFIRKISQNRANYSNAQIVEKLKAEPELERSVVNLHNFFGDLYLSIRHGRADEELLYQSFWSPYRIIHDSFRGAMQLDNADYASDNQNLDELYRRWHSRTKAS